MNIFSETGKKTTGTAYILQLFTLFGFAGIHRFYLGKPGSALLYLFTWGLFGFGSLYDLFNMQKLVQRANRERTGIDTEYRPSIDSSDYNEERPLKRRESVEYLALALGKKNAGIVTVSELALEAEISPDQAKAELESLVTRGHAEVAVRRDGAIVYLFRDFLSSESLQKLETS
jgi:TM2 domain-containing membrane protein YozV